jgi:hypothetical protein
MCDVCVFMCASLMKCVRTPGIHTGNYADLEELVGIVDKVRAAWCPQRWQG